MQVKNTNCGPIVGIPELFRVAAARLYDDASGKKLAVVIPNVEGRISLFDKHVDSNFKRNTQ